MLPLFTATPRTDPYGAALICDVLTAYRRDLERTPDIVQFGEADARWLTAGLDVERLTASPALGGGAAVVATRRALRPAPLLALTAEMEAAGALTLAYATLAAARRVWDRVDPPSAATAIFRQARICRSIGATQAAENHYSYLFSYATRHRLPELRGRALIGKGILRTLEGDAPAAYRWYAKARLASARNAVVMAVSYHGEMAAALGAKDFNRALIAGWRALEPSTLGSYDKAGVMENLASIALRVGRPVAALRAVRAALRTTRHARVLLTAYSKGALAAAELGRDAMVDRFAARLVATAASANFPIEELEARSELAQAYAKLGNDAKARRLARAVRRDALPMHLTVVVRRCDAVLAGTAEVADVAPLSAPANRVVLELERV
jgi:tetratricopeptide (TPR) repeat protein